MKKTIFYTDENGNKVPVEVNLNKDLSKKPKKNSKLAKKIATNALVLTIAAGVVVGICSLFKGCQNVKDTTPTTSATGPTLDETDGIKGKLRFNPNSKEAIINNAVLLIEEAAKCGKELDAEDAVLATIVANSNQLSAGFMGELFGERANQTYTYGSLVDAYLRVGMMEVENIGVAKNDEVAFNIENIFASQEDYDYLYKIRELTTRYNNSTDDAEKAEITKELNQMALDLCTYEAFDISSPAGILAMLSLDGMRIVSNNTNNPILHDDIRDEMFGNGDYACTTNATYTLGNGQVLQTQYSYRVNDLKLDNIKSKLDNAILVEGKSVILDEIIDAVKVQTKDVEKSEFDVIDEINDRREEDREVVYEYEEEPGVVKPGYTEIDEDDVVENIGGEEVIVVPAEPTVPETKPTEPKPEETLPPVTEPEEEETLPIVPETDPEDKKHDPKVEETEPVPTPEIKEEINITPEPGEEIADNKEDALEALEQEAEYLQAETDKGAADGKYYGENGLDKPSFDGKSETYINAFNTSYDAWKAVYDAIHSTEEDELVKVETVQTTSADQTATVEEVSLDSLSKEQLEALRNAAMGDEEYTQGEAEKTKSY